jgi:hypothetical protein
VDVLRSGDLRRFSIASMEERYVVALIQKLPDDERADEARPSENEDPSHAAESMKDAAGTLSLRDSRTS